MTTKPQTLDRIPPNSAEAESAVLGSIFLDPTTLDAIRAVISPLDFFQDHFRKLFEMLCRMADAGQPVNDILAVIAETKRCDIFEFLGGAVGIAAIFQSTPHAAHAVFYAQEVANAASLRNQIRIAEEIIKRAFDRGSDPAQIRGWAEAQLAATSSMPTNAIRTMSAIAIESVAAMKADIEAGKQPGVMFGIYSIDRCFGSLARGELSVLAARTSVGKTSLAVQIAENCAKRGNAALVVSLEMTGRELVNRILAKHTKIDGQKIRELKLSQSDLHEMNLAAHALGDFPLLAWDPSEATAGQIRGVARMEHAHRPLSLLVVDYLGLVKPVNRNREVHEQLGDTCILLKSLAKELGIPVLCLAQLNRNADNNTPSLAMLKSSGAIEETADQVMFLHKENPTDKEVLFIVSKNRNGDKGKLTLGWDAKTTTFFDPKEPTEPSQQQFF